MAQKFIRIVFLLLCANTAATFAAEIPKDPAKFLFNETWGDFKEEARNAKAEGKKGVFIFFEMDECPFCHYMKMNVLNQPDVQKYFRDNFLNFDVDIEGDVEMTDFDGKRMKQKDFAFKEFRVRATPVLAFFDLDGKLIHRYTGKTSGKEEFMLMGNYVVSGKYKEPGMTFTRFKREQPK